MLLAIRQVLITLVGILFGPIFAIIALVSTHSLAKLLISKTMTDAGVQEIVLLLLLSRESDWCLQILVESIVIGTMLQKYLNHVAVFLFLLLFLILLIGLIPLLGLLLLLGCLS